MTGNVGEVMARGRLAKRGRLLLAAVILVLVAVVAVVAGGCGGGGSSAKKEPSPDKRASAKAAAQPTKSPTSSPQKPVANPAPKPSPKPAAPQPGVVSLKNPVTVLVVGTDASRALTDVNLLVYLNPANGQARVLWVPRDTRVSLPRHGICKINAAHAYGGIALLKSTISRLTGISPQYYLRVDFQAFTRIIDLLGGVELTIAKAMRYRDRRGGLDINLKQGRQSLDGPNALKYVRFRADGHGDVGRIGRQKHFILALFNEVVGHRKATLAVLPKFFVAAKTDIPQSLARALLEQFAARGALTAENLYLLPGEARYIGGISYYVPDEERIAALVAKIKR